MAIQQVAGPRIEDEAIRLVPSQRCGICTRPFGPAEVVHPDRNREGVLVCRRCWINSATEAKDPQLQLW